MHITLFVYGSWGDLRPFVVLGKGLQAAGHDVQIAAPQDYEAWIRARDLDYHPIKVNVGEFTKYADQIENPLQGLRLIRDVMKPAFVQMGLDMHDAMRDSDVMVTIEFGLSLLLGVMQANDFKTIIANPAPLNSTGEFPSAMPPAPNWFPFPEWYNRLSYDFIQRVQWTVLAGARNELNQTLGLPKSKFKDFQATIAATPALTIVSPHVVQRPADWDEHFQVTGYLFDDDPDWTPPQDLTDFLAAGEAPVYIGFGSMPDSKPEATTRTVIEAVRQAGKRAVILTGWAGLGADDVPANIHILKYAPHHWLFPQMAAVVHHGGAGTTAAGLRAGVPTTIVPHNGDQPYWGRTLKQLGVGTDPIPRKKLSVENLYQAIQTATASSTMREKARVLGVKIQQEDGLAEAVQVVKGILERESPSR